MHYALIKSIVVAIIIGLFPLVSQADDTNKLNDIFKTACVKAWMKRATDASDAVDFRNFGEKYCGCVAYHPLNSEAAIHQASQICLSQTLLHDTMDSFETEHGLAGLTEEKAIASCQDRWNLIYPKMEDNLKAASNTYCKCAAPKLVEINKGRDNFTDKQWYAAIDKVAADCATKVIPDNSGDPDKSE